MGKRELLIALAFLVVGVVAWQVTAPPATAGGGFSLRDLWNRARREIQADSQRATATRQDSLAVGSGIREIRLSELPRSLKVIGEPREDVAYELIVEATGPTAAEATANANRVAILTDELGETLSVRIDYGGQGQRRAQLVLRVPGRLDVRAQAIRSLEATGLASLHLDGVTGETAVREIAGAIAGTHGGGDLIINGAGSVKLTLLPGSQARITHVRDGVTIDARNGEVSVTDSAGALEITGLNEEISIARHAGPAHVGGSGGRVSIDRPSHETRVDMRRAEIDATLRDAVPLALLTTDETVRLTLDGPPPVTLDAIATDARIDASAFALSSDAAGGDARLTHVFAPGATARVSIRNLRGDIVIAKTK